MDNCEGLSRFIGYDAAVLLCFGDADNKQKEAVVDFSTLNWFAVIVAAVSSFALGAIWYGPVFGKRWQELVKLSDEDLADANMAQIFGLSFVLTLIIAFALASAIGAVLPEPNLVSGLLLGLEFSLVFVATAFGINYLFARQPIALYGIDVGYMVLMFALMGAILGVWR